MSKAEKTQGSTGRLLAGRYRLGEVLGRGGMGTVWRAVDETLGRTVAIKELRFPSSVDEDEKRRLVTRTLREAKAIARIRSHGAVTVYDVVDEDDRPWIVMELIEGSSLADVIREKGTLTPYRAAEVGLAVLEVLRAAHREGILHRDVKPSNVLISDDGRVVLTDFGIAQVEGDPSVTSTGMLVGAPSYISPERARGHKPGPPSDLWSLGGLLYACVEGVPPYDKGSAIATLTAVMTEPLVPPKNAGPLAEVIRGLLEKDPEQRLDENAAQALLTDALTAPEKPEPPAPEKPEPTKAMPVPAQPAGEESATAAARRAELEARLRGALRSVRNAAAAAKARTAAAVPAGAPSSGEPERQAPPASITDVVPKRTLVILAAVVALVVLGTVLVFALGGGGSGSQGKGAKAKESKAVAGEANPGDAKPKPSDTASRQPRPESGTAAASQTPKSVQPKDEQRDPAKTEGEPGSGGLPSGFERIRNDRFKFSIAMPKGFTLQRIAGAGSGAVFSRSGGFPRLQVDFSSQPKSDAAAAWFSAEPAVRRSTSGYFRVRITPVNYRGYPTVADWIFEQNLNGERVRVLDRGFKVDDTHGYAIMITCKKSEWDGKECRTLRDTAFRTFKPVG